MNSPDLTMLETLTALKYLRTIREGLHVDLVQLEERLRVHGNGPTQGAAQVLAAEVDELDRIIQKLWRSMT